ncbi:MAG TPA: 16S rRNA (guanine(966)-N(2))-methyltransferase RsmD [Actinomycetota bacterium]|nr:16S rRNA (guanine(966)-N(2))-methyltransferase RsmD [Actinomycetota bacterium]
MPLRVIAGEAGGRRLKGAELEGIRPTSDKLKGAVFSRLADGVEGIDVLDLYSGSGALGIEALSRGARSAVFIEKNPAAARIIEENLKTTGLLEKAEVVRTAVDQYLQGPAPEPPFGLVLMDPPYEEGLPLEALALLRTGGFVVAGAHVVVEISSRNLPADAPEGFDLEAERRYGDGAVVYLRVKEG